MTISNKPTMNPKDMIEYRTSHNWSHKDFALIIGVTPQAVVLWESGARRVPETVVRLIKMFKRRPELVGEF